MTMEDDEIDSDVSDNIIIIEEEEEDEEKTENITKSIRVATPYIEVVVSSEDKKDSLNDIKKHVTDLVNKYKNCYYNPNDARQGDIIRCPKCSSKTLVDKTIYKRDFTIRYRKCLNKKCGLRFKSIEQVSKGWDYKKIVMKIKELVKDVEF